MRPTGKALGGFDTGDGRAIAAAHAAARWSLAAIIAVVGVGFFASANAQTIPGAADPGRVQQRFEPQPQPRVTTDQIVPQVEPERQIRGEAAKIKFVLHSLTVEGSTVYGTAALQDIWAGLVGKEITLGEAQSIADRITVRYRNDGYILSRAIIPAQRISGGVLKIQVIEGYIKDFRIDGKFSGGMESDGPISGTKSKLAAYARKIAAVRPVTAEVMERYLLLANDLPGITAQAVLAPAAGDEPGAATLILQVKRKALDFFSSTDNFGTRFSGPYQGQVGAIANSPLGLAERFSIRGINTLFDWNELHYFEGSYDEDIGNEGTKVGLGVSYSASRPGYTLQTYKIHGTTLTGSLRVTHPFIRSRTMNWFMSGSLDVTEVKTDNRLFEIVSKDHLRVARIGSSFDFVDRFRGVNLLSVQVSEGLPVLGYTKRGANSSRPEASGDFFKVSGEISRLQSLFMPGLNLYLAAQGQWSANKLLSSEEFGVGGSVFGRGYDPSEITGENGVATKVELQYGRPLNLRFLHGYQFFGFWDYGRIWNYDKADKLAGSDTQSLMSAGGGVRLNFIENLSGEFYLAYPLTRKIAGRGNNGDDWRGFFSLTARF